jgi:hypothetical protein
VEHAAAIAIANAIATIGRRIASTCCCGSLNRAR